WKLTRHKMRATLVYEFARATSVVTSFRSICRGRRVACLMRLTQPPLQKKFGGEDRNRTYLGPAAAGSTTVLKTARATRHPSLSELWTADCGLRKDRQSVGSKIDQEVFLIALTMALKSGQSPESSLEWRSLPLARISKAPPLDGMSVSDLMRSPRSRILAAKLTAFGV